MKDELTMELTARIRLEEGTYWADVSELPGCFATGDSLDELFDSLREAVALHLGDHGTSPTDLRVSKAVLTRD
jgi:predicted RNase H-like HicB family nuclease